MFYIKFTEHNDHEGETWYFWLSMDRNVGEFGKLTQLLLTSDAWGQYELDFNSSLAEEEVDVLVEHGGDGYMNTHNKVTGVFTCPDNLDDLYKGGIKDCFESYI